MLTFLSVAEIAAGFKEQGNELFIKRKFKDAAGFYSRALDEVGKDLPVEDKRTLWSNRAACNLELGQFSESQRVSRPFSQASSRAKRLADNISSNLGVARQLWFVPA